MNDDFDKIQEALQKEFKEHPEHFLVKRSDVLIQDIVTSSIAMALNDENFVKYEAWSELGYQDVLDASRLILKKEYDDMSQALSEINDEPNNAKNIIAKYFPDGLKYILNFRNIDLEYKAKINNWKKC